MGLGGRGNGVVWKTSALTQAAVRRFRARRAPRLRRRGLDTLRRFLAALLFRLLLRLAERETDDAEARREPLAAALAEEEGARGAVARRRRAFRFFALLPRRRPGDFLFFDAAPRRRRARLLDAAGDGEGEGAGAFGTDERLLRRRDDRDRERRMRLAELLDRELRERLFERDREEEAEALDEGALGVELRRRRRDDERRRRLRDRFGCFTLRDRGEADESRFRDSFRFARNSSFSFW